MRLALFALLVLGAACGPGGPSSPAGTGPAGPADAVIEIDSPAAPGSGEPNLVTGADGRLYLSWIEPAAAGDGHALRFSVWQGEGWSGPRTVAQGRDWFVNWADFPSLAALEDGTLAAHWLAKSGEGTYAYDVWLAVSTDGGETWSEPVRPHGDGTQTEHGFVSLVPLGDRFGVVWLDGRQMAAEPPGPMTARFTTLGRDGRTGEETVIEDRVCECCQTAAARTGGGDLVVLYRDRSPEEIRDVWVVRGGAGGWSPGAPVHRDGWKIGACPVNGPAVASAGDTVAAAWFTVEGERQGRVKTAFSTDGGRSFGEPAVVDQGNPLGRVGVVLLEDGSALVSWLELAGSARIVVRRVRPDGAMDEPRVAALTSGARSSGFPRMARLGESVFLAWTAPGEPSRVHTGVLR